MTVPGGYAPAAGAPMLGASQNRGFFVTSGSGRGSMKSIGRPPTIAGAMLGSGYGSNFLAWLT